MLSRILSIAVLSAVFIATMAAARPVEVTVRVLDPGGLPIEGAAVRIVSGHSSNFPAPGRTDAQGEIVITLDIPLVPIAVLRASVFDAPPATTPREEFFGELDTLRSIRMFRWEGYPVQVPLGVDMVSVVAQASPVDMRSGVAQSAFSASPDTFHVLDSSGPTFGFIIDGSFRSLVPLNRSFLAGIESDLGMSYHVVSQLQADGTVPPLTHAIPDATGGLAGTVTHNGPPPDATLFLNLIREDGSYDLAVSVDSNGRIALNQDNGPDPASVGEQIDVPPGTYVVTLNLLGATLEAAESISYLRGVYGNIAVAERAALPRITIQSGQRTVVNLSLEILQSTTEALINAVYFSP